MSDFLFISDLHLSAQRPEMIKLFLKFMDEVAPTTQSLYILGDFLEYWIGDDMDENIQGSDIATVFSAIQKLADSGTNVSFMHGNRDFLVGRPLADKYHFHLIDDPTVITINKQNVLLIHGDTLCTDDVEYLQFREMVRDTGWQQAFLSKSLAERKQIAKALREKSKDAVAGKKPDIMDVSQDAVVKVMVDNGVETLIHGHTHRPALHEFELDGVTMKRYVLADWYDSGSYLEVSAGDFNVISIR